MAPSSSVLPKSSAIVVAHSRPKLLRRCVASLLAQSESSLEVVVVLNDATETVKAVAEECASMDSRVVLVRCAGVSASQARNAGVAATRAPVLYFLDDDVEVPGGGVAALLEVYASRPGVSIVGGPNLTHPEDPEFAHLTGEILASRWGTGVARARYARLPERSASERDLILCNLAVHRSVFEEGARFPFHFGGEENVLMGSAGARGHELWYSPTVWVHHHRRSSLRGYAMQMRRYGQGRGIALGSAPGTFHAAYFAPVLLLGYLLLLPVLAMTTALAWLPLSGYAFGSVLTSALIAVRRRRATWALRLPQLFLVTHVMYAVGLVGVLLRGSQSFGSPAKAAPVASET